MVEHYNPALRQEPRSRLAGVIPPRDQESLYNWIEGTGRFKAYEVDETSLEDRGGEDLEEIMGISSYGADKDDEEEEMDLDD
jgi:Protein of unknown function (DUF3134)